MTNKQKNVLIKSCCFLLAAVWPILVLLGKDRVRKLVSYIYSRGRVRSFASHSPIIFVAVPRSASKTIALRLSNRLKTGLQLVGYKSGPTLFPSNTRLSRGRLLFSVLSGSIAHEHLVCDERTVNAISLLTDQLVVHVRDLRQVLVSLTEHYCFQESRLFEFGVDTAKFSTKDAASNYDYMINTVFPTLVTWTNGWRRYAENDSSDLKIKFVHFEEFLDNEAAYFDVLAEFYCIGGGLNSGPIINKHFRKGTTNEWRSVFTQSQLNRMNMMIDFETATYFGWPRIIKAPQSS